MAFPTTPILSSFTGANEEPLSEGGVWIGTQRIENSPSITKMRRVSNQAGAGSLLDVLDAQRAFNETMSTYYDAQADYRRAVSRLASVVGEEVIP